MKSRTGIIAAGVVAIWCAGLSGRAEAVACSAEPTDMSVGLSVQVVCTISPSTDTDLYRFSASAGDRILVEVLPGSGSALSPLVQLNAPDGTLLGNNASRLDVVVQQTGTFTAVVSSFASNSTGEYAFTASCLGGSCLPSPPSPPLQPDAINVDCGGEPTDMFTAFSTRVTCTLNPNTDTDVFRFVAGAGDRILIEAIPIPGSTLSPLLRVNAPDGTLLGANALRYDLTLTQSGTYTAYVMSFASNSSGQYAYTVSCIGGSCVPPPGRSPSLTLALTGCTTACHAGSLFTVQAHWKNPIAQTQTVELKIGLRLPDGTPLNILGNKHIEFPVPGNLDVNGDLFSFAWPSGLPQGTWTIEAAMIGPDLGDTFSRSVKTFKVVP